MTLPRWLRWLTTDAALWGIYSLATVAVSLQRLAIPLSAEGYTSYENYRIFRNAYVHLMQGLNPYAAYPAEQWDLYKYSPAFALAMAPWSVLPDWAGILLWNGINALVLLAAILRLPHFTAGERRFIGWFVLIELITSLQNSQSNGLMAGLMLWAWVACARDQPVRGAICIAGSIFIKIFGIFAAAPAVLYPHRWRFIIALGVWCILLAALPIPFIGIQHTVQVYQWWWQLLTADHSASTGISVLGWLETWWGISPSKTGVTAGGIAVLGLSWLAVARNTSHEHLARLWASVLLWVVIFNHKAESPTFIIAVCGVAIWYLLSEKGIWEKITLGSVFLFTCLSATDIFPAPLRDNWIKPYVLKAVPCIAVWIWLSISLINTFRYRQKTWKISL